MRNSLLRDFYLGCSLFFVPVDRKFHVDLTRRRLPKSRLKKLGMVPKELYRDTLNAR